MINIIKNDERSVPPLNELILLIFGSPGSGKTQLCDGIPKALFIATEPGHNFSKSPVYECRDWAGFRELITHLKGMRASGNAEHETFIIDIVDNFIGFCRDFICRRKNISYPPTNDFGKTWSEISAEWKEGLGELFQLGNIIFISHATTKEHEIEDESGLKTQLDQYVPTFSGTKASQFLDGIVNAQGFMTTDKKGRHWVTFKKSATVGAKDRTGVLSNLAGILIEWRDGKNSWQILEETYINLCEKSNFKIISRRK